MAVNLSSLTLARVTLLHTANPHDHNTFADAVTEVFHDVAHGEALRSFCAPGCPGALIQVCAQDLTT